VVLRATSCGLAGRTPHTITEASTLLRQLVDIRALGVATEREECALGLACVASPILGHAGLPTAAISVAGPVDGLVPDRVAPAVRAAAATLSRRLMSDS
jgi:DNA-binding IclR family transcriptional regulator